MVEMQLLGVRLEMPSAQPLVLIQERYGPGVIPIWVGLAEATAIAVAHEGIKPLRPLTHDLLIDVLTACGRTLESVAIPREEDGVFYGELRLDGGEVISSRASDAIALAQRCHCTLWCSQQVLENVGVLLDTLGSPEGDAQESEEEQVRRFRAFLDDVRPEDFRN